jgi:putative tRNA adenosine deaminase-associated protein
MNAQIRQNAQGYLVSHFAAAVVRDVTGWTAAELDITGAADVEDVAERLRDIDPEAKVSLLFVESDDTYLAIMRLDEGDDLRVFGSDAAFVAESRLGSLLLGDVEEPALDPSDLDDDDTDAAATDDSDEGPQLAPIAAADPVGDPDLLSDLGVPASRLLSLCGREGMLPSDVTAEVCQLVGCGDEVEELREA